MTKLAFEDGQERICHLLEKNSEQVKMMMEVVLFYYSWKVISGDG